MFTFDTNLWDVKTHKESIVKHFFKDSLIPSQSIKTDKFPPTTKIFLRKIW